MDKLAIVILNYNGARILNDFLPSVIEHAHANPIYVVDNASTDESLKVLENYRKAIHIIELKKNKGYAGGYNEGLKAIRAKYYALINSDLKFDKSSVLPILDHFDKNPNTKIVQPKILSYENPENFEFAGASGGYLDRLGYAYCRGRIFDSLEKDLGQYDDVQSIDWASGAALYIDSETFHSLKGFDEDYFAHYEEIDLCWRAKNQGYQIDVVPKAKVYHLGGGTLNSSSPFKTYLNFRNSLFTLLKNLPEGDLLPKIFTRLCLDGVAAIRFLLKGEFNQVIAVLKAHFSFYLKSTKIFRKRKLLKPIKHTPFHQKSIVFSYFIQKKRFYRDLK